MLDTLEEGDLVLQLDSRGRPLVRLRVGALISFRRYATVIEVMPQGKQDRWEIGQTMTVGLRDFGLTDHERPADRYDREDVL